MAAYRCGNCDYQFESHELDPRCPKCLRHNGIEEIDAEPRRQRTHHRKTKRFGVAVALGILVAIGVYVVNRQYAGDSTENQSKAPPKKPPLSAEDIRKKLNRKGLKQHANDPFETGPAMRAVASTLSGNPRDKVQTLAQKLALRLKTLDCSPISPEPIRDAETLASLLGESKLIRARPLELAVLVSAVLQRAGLHTTIEEVERVKAPMPTASVHAGIGRYDVVVYRTHRLKEKLLTLDPARLTNLADWAGGRMPRMASVSSKRAALSNADVLGHFLALKALQQTRVARQSPERAYELAEAAIIVAPRSATVRAARARVLSTAGGIKDALAEAQNAVDLRGTAADHTLLAQLALERGDAATSDAALDAALDNDNHYWPALQLRAVLAWSRGELEQGERDLKRAEAIAPEEPGILGARAQLASLKGNVSKAITILRTAIEHSTTDASQADRLRLQLYVALRQQGSSEEAAIVRQQLERRSHTGSTSDNVDSIAIRQALKQIDQAFDAATETPSHSPDPAEPPLPSAKDRFKLPDVTLRPR